MEPFNLLDLAPAKLKEEQRRYRTMKNPDLLEDYYQKGSGQMGQGGDLLTILGSRKTSSEFRIR